MPRWALVLSIGPVGAFIASGRRSRDLWWGSSWVSDCSLSVASFLRERPQDLAVSVDLHVPSPARVREIEQRLQKEDLAFGGRVTNHVEATVEADSAAAVAALAAACETEARRSLAQQVRENAFPSRPHQRQALQDVLDEERFEDQVQALEQGDFIEVYAAWARVDGENFSDALRRAWKLLDGRKAARVFGPPTWTRPGRAKSDLDPGRDSVLKTANTRDRRVRGPVAGRRHLARKILGIGPEEELDALGFARRMALFHAPGPELPKLPFPPISRVAIDPWLHRAARDPETRATIAEVLTHLRRTEVRHNPLFFSWCSPARDPESWPTERDARHEELFPFDASFFFEHGIQALLRELDRIEERSGRRREVSEARGHLHSLRPVVDRLHEQHGLPVPYYALLMMDGDGVGAALLDEEDLAHKRDLVKALDDFAEDVEKIIRNHHGCTFYVGGDDLAAYLPLDRILGAVTELSARFGSVSEEFAGRGAVTLSGGVAMAHVKADLRAVRSRAQDALSDAKRERRRAAELEPGERQEGWLAIYDLPRGGSERFAAGPLATLSTDLQEWIRLLEQGDLSLRSGHFLSDLADRFADGNGDGRRGLELARYRVTAQARRSFKKASPRLRERLGRVERESWAEASRLAAELAIASRLLKVGSPPPSEAPEEVAS